jgi:hypothetical protein
MSRRAPSSDRTWIEAVAGHIGDPILRLRFLKAVAPAAGSNKRAWWLRPWTVALVVLAIGLGALVFAVSRSKAKASTSTTKIAAPVQPVLAGAPPKASGGADVWLVEKSGE